MFWNWNHIYIDKNNELCVHLLALASSFSKSSIRTNCTVSVIDNEMCACFPAGSLGLTGCGEILDPSKMSYPPPLAMQNIWLLIMSLFPIVLSLLHVRIHLSPAELIKELERMLQPSEIAKRLSEPGNLECSWQSPTTDSFGGFLCCFVIFKWVFWHIVAFVPLGFLFLDESFPSAEHRSLSTWLLSSS